MRIIWLATLCDEERQVRSRRGIEHHLQFATHWQLNDGARLLLRHMQRTVTDVLPAHADHIAAALHRVQK
jgi:hypothetical protein